MKVNEIILESATHTRSVNELAPDAGGGGSSNYFQALASAWYNHDISMLADIAKKGGSPMKKIMDAQEAVEKMLQRGVIGSDGKTRKYDIRYNSDFDGVVIQSADYYEYSDYDAAGNEVDSRTGRPWGPNDYMEFGGDDLDEGIYEASPELTEEFDLIESIIERLAAHNGVDAEVIWEDLETLTEDELYAFAVTSEPIMEYGDTKKGQKMLTRVQKRAVDRVIKADDKNRLEPDVNKRDLKTVRKNAAIADRAWERMSDLDEQGMAEGSVYKKDQDLSSISTQELEAFVKKHWAGGIPTWGQGESVKRAMRELRRRQKPGVAEGPGFDKWADDRAASQLHKLKKPHPETWHDVDPKLGKAVDKMSQAEKVKKGLAHPDTLKKQGVAEGSETAADIDKKIEFHKQGQAAAQYKGSMNKMHAAKIRELEAKKAALKQGVAEGFLGDREYNRVLPFVKRIAGEVSDYDRDEFGEELWSLLDQKYGSKFAQSVLQDSLDFYWDEYAELTGQQGVAEGSEDDIEDTRQFRDAIALAKSQKAIRQARYGKDQKFYADGTPVTAEEVARRAAERKAKKKGVAEDWQKANKRDRTAGMSQKAVNAYRRENPGSKLKTAVTTKPSKLKRGSKASKRRKSYCSRSRGQMKMHSISCSKTPDKAICKARRRWNC